VQLEVVHEKEMRAEKLGSGEMDAAVGQTTLAAAVAVRRPVKLGNLFAAQQTLDAAITHLNRLDRPIELLGLEVGLRPHALRLPRCGCSCVCAPG
jgi:hypothetical protein